MLWFFKYFRRMFRRKKLAFLTQNKANLLQNVDHNIGFWEKRQFFRRKLSKIAENCNHNIDPWSHCLRPCSCSRCQLNLPHRGSDLSPPCVHFWYPLVPNVEQNYKDVVNMCRLADEIWISAALKRFVNLEMQDRTMYYTYLSNSLWLTEGHS
jgi:hypothetical protein